MKLASPRKRNEELWEKLVQQNPLCLNYRWEQKDGKERAYVELLLEGADACYSIRYRNAKVTRDSREVQELLQETSQLIRKEMAGLFPSASPTFIGYYLKGERDEHEVGRW